MIDPRRLLRALAALAAVVVAGCPGPSSDDPVVTPTTFDAATLRSVRGRATFAGTVPKPRKLPIGGQPECAAHWQGDAFDEEVLVTDGRLANAFVYVKSGAEAWTFAWPKTPVVVANEKCIYRPRVAGAQVHQPIRFTNADPTAHNIHGYMTDGRDFNFTLTNRGNEREIKVRERQLMLQVKCDIHPWMIGYVGVLPHPFFAVTGADGTFELKGLPPGDYVVEAWHETLGTRESKVKVEKADVADVDFAFAPK
jgi:plastocyanin